MWYLIFGSLIVLAIVLYIRSLEKEHHPPSVMVWYNATPPSEDIYKFHSSDLTFIYTKSRHHIRLFARHSKKELRTYGSIDFDGSASEIEFGKSYEIKTYKTKASSITTFGSNGVTYTTPTGSYEETTETGIYELSVSASSNTKPNYVVVTVSTDDRNKLQQIFSVIEKEQKVADEAAKATATQKIRENIRNQRSRLLEKAGINEADCFKHSHYWEKDGGYICALLAADKEGRGCAIYDEGKDTWSGSWKNAQINEVGDTLEVQIDDPEYRKQNLKERRFVIKYFSRENRLEWIDRIRILSAQA